MVFSFSEQEITLIAKDLKKILTKNDNLGGIFLSTRLGDDLKKAIGDDGIKVNTWMRAMR